MFFHIIFFRIECKIQNLYLFQNISSLQIKNICLGVQKTNVKTQMDIIYHTESVLFYVVNA